MSASRTLARLVVSAVLAGLWTSETDAQGGVERLFGIPSLNGRPRIFNPIRGTPYDVHPATPAQARFLRNVADYESLKDAKRLERILKDQEWQSRQRLDAYEDDLRHTRRLTTGGPVSFASLRSFRTLAVKYSGDSGVYSAMTAPVERTPADEFVPDRTTFNVVRPHGELARLPRYLQKDEACREADAELRKAWRRVFATIVSGGAPTYDEDDALAAAIDNFEVASRPLVRLASYSPGRHQANKHVRYVKSLKRAMYDEALAEDIAVYGSDGGLDFEGGRVQDLVAHLCSHRLKPKSGSMAQQHVADAAYRVAAHVGAKIDEEREYLEFLEEQHHWHDWIGPWSINSETYQGGKEKGSLSIESLGGAG